MKQLGMTLALAVCLVIALVLGAPSRKAEPLYHGVPLSSWLRAGSNGVDEIDVGLGDVGPSAIPCLINALSNSTLRGDALEALKAIGPGSTAVPALIEILQNGKPKEQYAAVECLIRIGPPARPAVPDLEITRRDENPVLRVLAAVALATIHGKVEFVAPDLVNEIKQGRYDPNRHPYWEYHLPNRVFVPPTMHKVGVSVWHLGTAAWYLGEIGPAANDALPVLKDQLRGSVDWQSLIAAEAIWKITGQAELVLPHLLQALNTTERTRKILAIRLLGEIGPAAQSALPLLMKLPGASITMRREITEALSSIDPDRAANNRRGKLKSGSYRGRCLLLIVLAIDNCCCSVRRCAWIASREWSIRTRFATS